MNFATTLVDALVVLVNAVFRVLDASKRVGVLAVHGLPNLDQLEVLYFDWVLETVLLREIVYS
jgi:hypothetical protein